MCPRSSPRTTSHSAPYFVCRTAVGGRANALALHHEGETWTQLATYGSVAPGHGERSTGGSGAHTPWTPWRQPPPAQGGNKYWAPRPFHRSRCRSWTTWSGTHANCAADRRFHSADLSGRRSCERERQVPAVHFGKLF